MSRGKQGTKTGRVERNRAFQRWLRERKRQRKERREEQQARAIDSHASTVVVGDPEEFARDIGSACEWEEDYETAKRWKRSKKKGKTNIISNMKLLGWEPDGEGWKRA